MLALALFTVAWFKLHVDGTAQGLGMDFEALIYGEGADSLCGGGDGAMADCTVLPGTGKGAVAEEAKWSSSTMVEEGWAVA